MKSINCCFACIALSISTLWIPQVDAQPILSKQEAIAELLENNFDISLASNNVKIAVNTADPKFVGFNPTVDASASAGIDVANSFTELIDGQEISGKGTLPVNANANVSLQYVLYQGNARNLQLEQLEEQVRSATLSERQTIELTILSLLVAYYEVARLTESVRALDETLLVSERRLQRARYSFEYGQGNRLQILNAEVDINRDSVNLINAQRELQNAKRDVNVILARNVDDDFEIDTSVLYANDLMMRELLDSALVDNPRLLVARKDIDILQYDRELVATTGRPTVSVNGALNANVNTDLSGQSFINYSTNYGGGAGVSLIWNLYDGGVRSVQRENARLAIENQRLFVEQLEKEVERDVRNAWEVYENALFVLQVEEHNLSTNRENFARTQEQFNIGQVTSVEFRQAQFNLLNAEINYATAKYTAKVAELRLLQLCGRILDAEY